MGVFFGGCVVEWVRDNKKLSIAFNHKETD